MTIKTRKAELVAMVRKAVSIDIPLEAIMSLAALFHPDVAAPVLDAYWQDDGDKPRIYTIELASKLLVLARYSGLDQDAINRLEDIRATLDEYRQGGLPLKNLAIVRQVLTPGLWRNVVNLPTQLMRNARANLSDAPIKAALSAQIAVALLCFAPIWLGNLVAIRGDQNLIKPGGPRSAFWLTFPHYDVKNRVPLEDELTALIDEYTHQYRPHLLRGSNSDSLFPGESGAPKTANMFSGQITDCA